MRLVHAIVLLICVCATQEQVIRTRSKTAFPQGPPRTAPSFVNGEKILFEEPQPPAIPINVKAPAPPLEQDLVPQPPADPDPEIVALFEMDPDNFEANYEKWKREKELLSRGKRHEEEAPKTTFDSFVTLALVTGLDMRSGNLTFFAPSDSFLKSEKISLARISINNPPCASAIVRSHVTHGKQNLLKNASQLFFSLDDNPIFVENNEVNGFTLEDSKEHADYGVVHVVRGVFVTPSILQHCPELNAVPKDDEPSQPPMISHKVNQKEFLDEHLDSLDLLNQGNDLENLQDDLLFDVVLPNADVPPNPEEPGVHELLAKIDDFAKAMKLTWESNSDVVGILQRLGASTLLALLERANYLEMLAQGTWTLFAPSNKAWQALPEHAFNHIIQNPALLEQVLSYHIVPGVTERKHFKEYLKLESLNNRSPVHINYYTDGFASWYTASGSLITDLDETASNGVVHVVDSVLLPPFGNLSSAVAATPALQRMAALIHAVKENLQDIDETPITAFLPIDTAFEVYTDPVENLVPFVKRHVVQGVWFTSGLIGGDEHVTLNGERLHVGYDKDCVGVNRACILVRDITLNNGVLHVVDKVL